MEGALVDYDTATRIESRKLAKISDGQTARKSSLFFYDLNAIKAGKGAPGKGVSPVEVKKTSA